MKRRNNGALTKLADAAFLRAAAKVIERAEASGTPIIVWENEKVKRLTPRQARALAKNKTTKPKA